MRLIDADAVFKLVKGFRDTKPEDITRRKYVCNAILLVLQDEKELPTIDAAPVVRCKDCRNCAHDKIFGSYWCNRMVATYKVKPDDFCSYGKRKDGDG